MTIKTNFLLFSVVAFCLMQENNLFCSNDLFSAIENGNITNFKKSVRNNSHAISQPVGPFKITPLAELPHHFNYPFTIKALAVIAKKYPSLQEFEKAAHDAYWNAAEYDNMIFIRLLANYAAIQPDLINQQNHLGNTLLHIIAMQSNLHKNSSSERKHHRKALRILQAMNANPAVKNYIGQTPADLAKHQDIKDCL
jgi:ankyrin repeat protein